MTTPSVSPGPSPIVAASSPRLPPQSPSRPLLSESGMRPSTAYVASSHPGCVLCGLVASAASQMTAQSEAEITPTSATSSHEDEAEASTSRSRGFGTTRVGDREVVYRDHDITVYPATGKERLCPEGRHLIMVLNRHVESVYDLGPSDVPILSHILSTAEDLLYALPGSASDTERVQRPSLRVGFVAPIMRDPQIPHAHLHAHAMLGPVDTSLPGAGMWRRNVVFGSMNWWSIEDLRAEIRESTSNNRVKSGYTDRPRAPIDRVPDAGSRSGPSNTLPSASWPSEPMMSSPSLEASPNLNQGQSSVARGKLRAEPSPEDPYEAVDLGSRP